MTEAELLALIPAYNESERIARVVQGAREHVRVCVVDDGSRDNTQEVAQRSGAEVLRQEPNQGKGAALRMGFAHALAVGVAGVITLDADGQHDPAEIPLFVDNFRRTQAELVIGCRDFSKMPPIRRLANTTGRMLLSWAMGQRVEDNQSGYRLIGRRLMQVMLDSGEHGFEFEVEMVARCIRMGWGVEWVPISTIYAGEKSHIKPLPHAKNFMRVVMKIRKERTRGE